MPEGLDAAVGAAMAKALGGEMFIEVCHQAHEVFAAIGMTREHDLQLYARRAKLMDLNIGDSTYQRDRAAVLLGYADC